MKNTCGSEHEDFKKTVMSEKALINVTFKAEDLSMSNF